MRSIWFWREDVLINLEFVSLSLRETNKVIHETIGEDTIDSIEDSYLAIPDLVSKRRNKFVSRCIESVVVSNLHKNPLVIAFKHDKGFVSLMDFNHYKYLA